MLRAQLLNGSGTVFTAARVEALVLCEVSATPPASSAAAHRHSGGAVADAPKAITAAAGGRIKVCTVSHTVSTKGILSARNSMMYSAMAAPRTIGCATIANGAGR